MVDNRMILIRDYGGEYEYLYHDRKLLDSGHHVQGITKQAVQLKVTDYGFIGLEPSHKLPLCLAPYTELGYNNATELSHMPDELPLSVWNDLWLERNDE